MRCIGAWTGALLASLAVGVSAGEADGFVFAHHDWELACDNTGTCRAAGYQDYDDAQPVSVLLIREPGPGTPVIGKLRIGEGSLDTTAMEALRPHPWFWITINGERAGQVQVNAETLMADLSDSMVDTLLSALQRDSEIEFVYGEQRWQLSDTGATAVLLKMDDAQGRVDTPGAIVRTGSRPEQEVPGAEPAPLVLAHPVPTTRETKPAVQADIPAIRDAIRASTPGDDECLGLDEPERRDGELSIVRLSDTQLLASTLCWTAAYNLGHGYWVVNDAPPYEPVQVTESGSGYEDGVISAAHKGRGLGDCWSGDEWTWNGERFVHTSSFSMGMCRLIAAGGAWKLPTLVTEVRAASDPGPKKPVHQAPDGR